VYIVGPVADAVVVSLTSLSGLWTTPTFDKPSGYVSWMLTTFLASGMSSLDIDAPMKWERSLRCAGKAHVIVLDVHGDLHNGHAVVKNNIQMISSSPMLISLLPLV